MCHLNAIHDDVFSELEKLIVAALAEEFSSAARHTNAIHGILAKLPAIGTRMSSLS